MRNLHLSFIFYKPTPYHNTLLNYFSNKENISINVYYLVKYTHHHSWKIDYPTYNCIFIENYRILWESIRNLINIKPDIVLIAGFFNPICLLYFLFFKLFSIRFATWGDVPRLNRKRNWLKRAVRKIIFRWIYNNAAAILTMGQVGIDAFKAMGFQNKKLGNLPLSIDPDEALRVDDKTKQVAQELKAHFAPHGEIIFLGAGQLISRKCYDLAIRSFHQALSQSSHQQAVILFAGDGPEKCAFKRLAEELGVGDKVHFLGWCQPEEMRAIYCAGDVFIHPASWEPYGAVILEAMSWGLPVLASDQTMAALDRVVQGRSGFIHAVGDMSALSDHIKYFLDDPTRISLMGRKARNTAENWPLSRCVRPIVDLLMSCPESEKK